MIEEKGCDVKLIILTHAHFDHIIEIDSWAGGTGAKVLVGRADAPMLSDSNLNCYKSFMGMDKGYSGPYFAVCEGNSFGLGTESVEILETPGHSPGSISILAKDKIFVGDTVFADGGVGRCDLPGGDFLRLRQSIKKLLLLPPKTKVYSGHGRETTIEEIKINFI